VTKLVYIHCREMVEIRWAKKKTVAKDAYDASREGKIDQARYSTLLR